MVVLPSFLVLLAVFTVGGALRKAGDEEFPFQVSIKSPENRHLCGGVIITPKWVLTVSSCVKNVHAVRVMYGSADSNSQGSTLSSQRIEMEPPFSLLRKDRLALIELQGQIEISKTAKQAKLPTAKAELRNTTKLAAWKITQGVNLPPDLYVSDVYYVIPTNCTTSYGSPVHLDTDEFCGMSEDSSTDVSTDVLSLGSTVSKAAVALGILSEFPVAAHYPYKFVKLSEHDDWIRSTLGSDAKHVDWVDDVPKDSAAVHGGMTALLVAGISVVFLRFV